MSTSINIEKLKELFKNKSSQMALAGVTLILAISFAAYLAFPSSEPDTENNVNIIQSGINKQEKDNIDVDNVDNKTVEDTSKFKSRDLFQALVASGGPNDDQVVTGAVNTSSTSAYDDGKSNWPSGSGTSGGTSSGNNTGSNPPPATPAPTVTWMRLESISDTLAVVRFVKEGSNASIQLYELEPGEKFEENYMVVAIGDGSAVVWKGDERIELKLGEAYYIQ